MTQDRETIREIDLLAYADGLLDGDPVRAAAVRRHLEHDAEAARFVGDIVRQNEEIRALYGSAIGEPIPERHLRTLWESRRRRGVTLGRAAAALVIVGSAGWGGWLVGQRDGVDYVHPTQFIQAVATASRQEQAPPLALPAASSASSLLDAGNLWLSLAPPDLSAYGYRLKSSGTLAVGEPGLFRLVYEGPDGGVINIFLRPRDGAGSSEPRSTRADGVSVSHWSSGPFAVAVTGTVDEPTLERIGSTVRSAVKALRFVEPQAATAAAAAGDAGSAPPGLQPGFRQAPEPVRQVN